MKAVTELQRELESQVQSRTNRRVRNLTVELQSGCIVLRGRTSTYHVKQLVQQGIREVLPDVPLENAIVVEQ